MCTPLPFSDLLLPPAPKCTHLHFHTSMRTPPCGLTSLSPLLQNVHIYTLVHQFAFLCSTLTSISNMYTCTLSGASMCTPPQCSNLLLQSVFIYTLWCIHLPLLTVLQSPAPIYTNLHCLVHPPDLFTVLQPPAPTGAHLSLLVPLPPCPPQSTSLPLLPSRSSPRLLPSLLLPAALTDLL
jgi:hypothetical protein